MASVLSTACFQPASGGEQEKFQLITTSQTFDTGAQLCTTLNPPGLAASFHSIFENNLAFNMYILAFPLSQTEIDSMDIDITSPFFDNGVFLGLRDPVGTALAGDLTTTRFSYVDGTTFDFGSTGHQLPWDSPEPNNFQDQAEDCIEYNRQTGLWNDINCTFNRRMFCRTKCNAPTPFPTSLPTKAPTPFPTSLPSKAPTNNPVISTTTPTQQTVVSTTVPTLKPIVSTNTPTSQPFVIIQDGTSSPTQNASTGALARNDGQLSTLVLALILVGAIIPVAVIILLAVLRRHQISKRNMKKQNDSSVSAGNNLVFGIWKSRNRNAKDIYLDLFSDEAKSKENLPSGIRPESVKSPRFSMNSINTRRPKIESFDGSQIDTSDTLAPVVRFKKQFSSAKSPLFREDPSQFSHDVHASEQLDQAPRYKVSDSVSIVPAVSPRGKNIHISDT